MLGVDGVLEWFRRRASRLDFILLLIRTVWFRALHVAFDAQAKRVYYLRLMGLQIGQRYILR